MHILYIHMCMYVCIVCIYIYIYTHIHFFLEHQIGGQGGLCGRIAGRRRAEALFNLLLLTVRLNNHRKRNAAKRPGSGRNGPKRLVILRKRIEPKQPGRGNESKRNGQVKETKRTEMERSETNSFLVLLNLNYYYHVN